MNEDMIIEQISQAVIDGDEVASAERTRLALASGIDPMLILNAGLMTGAEVVGKRFEQGEYFLPELLLTARALKSAMDVIKPALLELQSTGAGRVSGPSFSDAALAATHSGSARKAANEAAPASLLLWTRM